MENFRDNNIVKLGGEILGEPKFSHESYEEKFYKFFIKIKRHSELFDEIPVVISERLVDIETLKEGDKVLVKGQCRSYNQIENSKSRLILLIFAKEIEKTEDESILTLNEADFIGYICKKPIVRTTPLGRDIADVVVAVNRSYKKSDYIPTIIWGRNSKFCEKLQLGTCIKVSGRIQSRMYEKKLEDDTVVKKTAYELSVSKLSLYDDEKKVNEVKEKEQANNEDIKDVSKEEIKEI